MLYVVLKRLFHLPRKHMNNRNKAPCYEKWKNLVIILDCTEVFMETPSNLLACKQAFSSYKHHITSKFMVGCSCNCCINYVSAGWGGRASDKAITESSEDLLAWLSRDDLVMSDKGFLVASLLSGLGVNLVLPPFKGDQRPQFTGGELIESEEVSSARIHVEQHIKRIKGFEILDGNYPLSMIDIIDQVFTVCAYLTNFQTSIINY